MGSNSISKCRILGVDIAAVTYESLHAYILGCVRAKRKSPILNVNVNAMNIAMRDEHFFRLLSDCELVFADGSGIVYASRLLGCSLPGRITYADWIPELARFSSEHGLSWFLLGGRPGVAELAAKRLGEAHKHLRIAGYHHGFFDRKGAENDRVTEQIARSKPDILIVAFGMPLQEKWIDANLDALDAHVILPGGACLDYISGRLKRCPTWIGKMGLEWLYRLFQEPRRLSRRYLIGNPLFAGHIIRYHILKRRISTHQDRSASRE